ncbi:MAG: class I SAM-dependent methyltransferase [Janthinobacterium lividum]
MSESSTSEAPAQPFVGRRAVSPTETVTAQRRWWDAEAADYRVEHGAFLGPGGAGFVWGPDGLQEEDAGLLGDVAGRRVLEFGAGAAQCARWLAGRGAQVVATDLSMGMLREGVVLDRQARSTTPLLQCDARALPFMDNAFDAVFTSYGALPFVADADRVLRECARVLRPGGRFAASVAHPIRWTLPDVPGAAGLTACHSYFDRTPYVEADEHGIVSYVEHHRTVGDWVRLLRDAGLQLVDLVEPEWLAGDAQWGGWSRLRGDLLPGTLILVAELPRGQVHDPA